MTHYSTPPLCTADDGTFWAWNSWPAFASWADRDRTLVVIPLAGMADWGLGHALDAEETVLMAVLREASLRRPRDPPLLVVPPLRFVFGPDPGCAFAVAPPVAHALVAEMVGSVAAAGFRRIVLFNSSPWNEELCAAASRDLRIRHDLQIFRVNLSAIGLDLHPMRSLVRTRVQTLVTALTGREPEPPSDSRATPAGWGDEVVFPLLDPPVPLAEAQRAGPAILSEVAGRLAGLFTEMQARPHPVSKLVL